MKYLLICLLLGAYSSTSTALEPDKQKHIAFSALISSTTYGYLRHEKEFSKRTALATAVTTAMLVGFAKEMTDDQIDTGDLAADGAGAILGPALFMVWEY